MTPDYQRIAELEYELGFTDEPPPSRLPNARSADAVLKELWTQSYTDRPGRVIFYDPRNGVPRYDAS